MPLGVLELSESCFPATYGLAGDSLSPYDVGQSAHQSDHNMQSNRCPMIVTPTSIVEWRTPRVHEKFKTLLQIVAKCAASHGPSTSENSRCELIIRIDDRHFVGCDSISHCHTPMCVENFTNCKTLFYVCKSLAGRKMFCVQRPITKYPVGDKDPFRQ